MKELEWLKEKRTLYDRKLASKMRPTFVKKLCWLSKYFHGRHKMLANFDKDLGNAVKDDSKIFPSICQKLFQMQPYRHAMLN